MFEIRLNHWYDQNLLLLVKRRLFFVIRLIAIDMDGTLLSPVHTISSRNKKAILAAQKSGIEVVIATGRGYQEAIDPVSVAKLTLPYICLNGADVRDEEGHVISATYLVKEDLEHVQLILEKNGIDHHLFIGEHIYTKGIEEQIELYIQLAEDANVVPPIDAIRKEIMTKVEDGYIREVSSYHDLIKRHGDKVYKVFGSSNHVDQ